MASHKRWQDLGPGAQAAIAVGAIVQLGLFAAAQIDIGRQRPDQLNGPRGLWRAVSFINFLGPIAYFVVGRRKLVTDPVVT